MHMAPRAAAWVAWAVWTCNTPQQGIRSKESGLRSALFLRAEFARGRGKITHGFAIIGADTGLSVKQQSGWFHGG